MIHNYRMFSVLCCATAAIGFAVPAQAEYFVRPVLQYGGGLVDGLSQNNLTEASQTFNDGTTSLESHVDLSDGTIKTYLQMYGPSGAFAGATGVMGEQITYTGASDVPVAFNFAYDAQIFAEQVFTGTPPENENRYIAVDAYFAVYEAGTGANYASWTVASPFADLALYNDRQFVSFQDQGESFSEYFTGSLGTELFLTSGKAYEVFAAFNVLAIPGTLEGYITMDALNTSTIGIDAPGGSFTSLSGEFLGFAQTPASAVPEPASWAMMLIGFGVVGSAARRRRRPVLAMA